MKKSRFAIFLSLGLLTGCATPLTGIQKCALIGEVYAGSSYGSQTVVGSTGRQVYSYIMPTINPRCRLPQTAAERAKVDEIRPEAQEQASENNKIFWAWFGGMMGALWLFTVILYSTI